jgi:sRNA-binding carbon storage regulator CsrA
MTHVSLRVDEAVRIGRGITVSPTDVDPDGVRLRARGRVAGGAQDGEPFDAAHELTVGQSVHLGPHVLITLVAINGDVARLGVFAPPHMPVSV